MSDCASLWVVKSNTCAREGATVCSLVCLCASCERVRVFACAEPGLSDNAGERAKLESVHSVRLYAFD